MNPAPPLPTANDSNIHPLEEILNDCEIHGVDVLALQDIHAKASNAQRHMNFCLQSHVTTSKKPHSNGSFNQTTAILSRKSTCSALVNRWKGFDGRVTSQTFSLGPHASLRSKTRVVILSVYAPTSRCTDRAEFFTKLAILIVSLRKQKKLVILTGDLNLAPSDHDRSSKLDYNNERAIFALFLKTTGLLDAFREKHPDLPAASYRKTAQSGLQTSRIDHILVDPLLQHAIIGAKILTHKSFIASDQGDHRMVIVHFNKSMIFGKPPPPQPPRPRATPPPVCTP